MRRSCSVLLLSLLACGDDDVVDTDAALLDASVARDQGVAVDAAMDVADMRPLDMSSPADASPADSGVDQGSPEVDGGPVVDPTFRSSTRHVAHPAGTTTAPAGHWEYLPPSYDPAGAPSPLLLFFHGLGENGDGSRDALDRVLRHGPPRFIDRDEWPNTRPFIVLSMQNMSGCPGANRVRDFLDWAVASYNVDPDRLYLTGLSCGSIGVSNYLRVHVDTSPVAAVVGISGNWRSAWNDQGCALGGVAVWGIHGDADANGGTPPASTEEPLTELIACPAPPRRDARLNMLPGVGHGGRAWNDTYDGSNGLDIYTWMLDQHL